jgi:DNA-directed RNA polymerase beta' subunit
MRMKKFMNDDDRKKIAEKAREIKKDNPELTLKKIAPTLGIAASSLSRILNTYPEKPADDDIPKKVMENVMEEFKIQGAFDEEEIIKGYMYFKGTDSWFNSMRYKVKIPAGLSGNMRKLALHSAVLDELKIEEV